MQTTSLKGARLSLQQERLWAWQSESQAYRAQCGVLLTGILNEAALQQALEQLVEQHEILQTVFYCLPGMDVPVQVIGRRQAVCCPTVNLQEVAASRQQAVLESHFTLLGEEAFDLAHGPLLRTVLFHLSAESYMLLLSLPALCADAATLPLLIAELSRRYEANLKGLRLVEEPLQYTAISAWQQKLLVSESMKTPREFWSRFDFSSLAQMHLPFERAGHKVERSPKESEPAVFRPQALTVTVDEALSMHMHALVHHYGVSMAPWLLMCWYLVLSRVTDKPAVVIGVAGNGRIYEELANAPGPYTRFVPVSIHCEASWACEQLLTSVSLSLQEAMRWQTYFTWASVRDIPADGENPEIFPLTFEYENWPATITCEGVSISLARHCSCTEPFVLKLSALQVGERVQLELHYDPRRISAEQARCLADALHTLLRGAVEQPQAPAGTLPILGPSEREQLLKTFRAVKRPLPAQGLHQLFEAQVERMPCQMAVVSAQEQLTYQELNCQANQLAWMLRQRGVGPNVLVGLCVSRSAQMLVGVLAILKAGGAYVPLDPESPAVRLAYQLQDIQAPLLLTQQALLPRLPEWGGETLCLEAIREEMAQASQSNLPVLNGSDELAYVIYTSGSTGVPKGVMIQHHSLVNYTLALSELLEGEPGWQYATVSTLSADLGNTAIFCALVSGGCVQVLDYATITSAEAFARWVARHPIDVLKIVPSHLSALLTSGGQAGKVLPRRALVLGGEALPPSLMGQLRELGGKCRIYNHYGPTETTIGVLVNVLGTADAATENKEFEEKSSSLPLGRPIANIDAYVLDPWQQVVPVEVTGELYVGGTGLALGYLHQPEQTAERFVPHPFSEQAGARLYRTGDLARYTAGGQIEFVGRHDGQVKLRGYRIELGEIEAVLRRHPNVRNGVVLLQEGIGGQPHLVGYVMLRKQPAPSSGELHDFVRAQVPEYMVPSSFVYLKALPLTTNGKVDRRQLIAADVNENGHVVSAINPGSESTTLVLPRDITELQLLRIWEEILQRQPVSILDNFFDLGGHSILAVRLMAHILKQFGQDLALTTLFLHPTIADLAVVLRQQSETERQPVLVAIRAQGSRAPFFCVHPSGGTVFSYINLARYLGPDHPFYGLQTVELSAAGDALATVEDLAAYYITAIQAVQPQGPYLLGGWSMGGVIAFEMAQQLLRQGQEVAVLAIIDSTLADSRMRARAMEEEVDLGDEEIVRVWIRRFKIAVADDFYQSELEVQVNYVLEQVKKLNVVPIDVGLEQIRRIFHIGRVHSRMARLYVPQRYPHRIDYFASDDSISQPGFVEGLSAEVPVKGDDLGLWRELALGGIEVHPVPGSHGKMIEEPNVQILAESLRHCIDRIYDDRGR